MNKQEFLGKMRITLLEKSVPDIDDILEEYEEHFRFKMADGYAEAEIAAKLGDPKALALQFIAETVPVRISAGQKVLTGIGLAFADICAAIFFLALFAFVIIMAATTLATASLGVVLIGNIPVQPFIPAMPYSSALLFAIAILALAVLTVIGTLYCYLYVRQWLRAYSRFHKNKLAAASGDAVYPALAWHPQLSGKLNRRLRNMAMIAVSVFAIAFIAGFIVSAYCAGALGFWHKWNWFAVQ